MRNKEATALFKEADDLYRQGKAAEALEVLTRLDTAFPNSRNILYPKALCLYDLGRTDEARRVCDVLLTKFRDSRAEQLVQKMTARAANAAMDPMADLMTLNILDDEPRHAAPAKHPPAPRTVSLRDRLVWPVTILILAAILVFAFANSTAITKEFRGLQAASFEEQQKESPDQARLEQIGMALFGLIPKAFLGYLVFMIAKDFVALYLVLHITDKLPETDTEDNLKNVGLMALIFALLSIGLCMGTIGKVIILKKRYELNFGEISIWVGISLGLFVVFDVAAWIFV